MGTYDVKITGRDPESAAREGEPAAPKGQLSDAPPSKPALGEARDRESTPGRKEELPVSVRLALNDVAGQIEIRDSDGKIRIHDLPSPAEVREGLVEVELRDSVGPVRRDSLGMRMLVKDSWSAELRKRRKAPSAPRDLIRSVASWVLLLAASVDVLALLFEPLFLLRGGAPLRPAIAAALASVGLAIFFAMAAAVPLATAHGLVRLIGRQKKPWRHFWPAPLLVLGWVVVANLAPHKVIHSFH